METLIRLLDELDDVLAVVVFHWQRALSQPPKERRRLPRLANAIPPTPALPSH